jgi:hypothetical protein
MIDLIVNAVMLIGISVVTVPVLLFAVTGVVHMVHGIYTLSRRQ